MSSTHPQFASQIGGSHPVVVNRRVRGFLRVLLSALVPLAIALAIAVAFPKPNAIAIFGGLIGGACVFALMLSQRYEVTLALLALYLGVLDGPIKLESSNHQVGAGLRDVLIISIGLGMIMRIVVRRERVSLPPLSGWVLAFIAVVLIEALNPNTHGILKTLGGYRQQLEWVPFFFFGYLLIRSKDRFRKLFLILGVIALANGLVGAVQSRLSPSQLARWGPGYAGLVTTKNGLSARTYSSEGVARARPPALGSDSGFGGGVGVVALPGLLALLAVGGLRRRWPAMLCCIGALLGIATAASRTSVVVGVMVLLAFAVLSLAAGLRVGRPLAGLVAVLVLAALVISVLLAVDGKGIFSRQETLTSVQRAQETGAAAKERSLSQIPFDIQHAPFGLGLGTAGSVSGFGGHQRLEIEGQKVGGGSAYNLLMKELGLPGLALWIGLTLSVITIMVRRLRRVADPELRTYFVGLLTAFVGLTVEGFSGPTLAVSVGAFLWFVPGVVAYWFAGPGWRLASTARVEAV